MKKVKAVVLTLLCCCMIVAFGAFCHSNKGTWRKVPVQCIFLGSSTDKHWEEWRQKPARYIWVRDQDGAVIRDDESLVEKLKRWFAVK